MDCFQLKISEQFFLRSSCWAFVPLQSGRECTELPHTLPVLSVSVNSSLQPPSQLFSSCITKQTTALHTQYNLSFCPDFPLQMLIWAPPSAGLVRLSLGVSCHRNISHASRIFSSWHQSGLQTQRDEWTPLKSHLCFTKSVTFLVKSLAWAWTI